MIVVSNFNRSWLGLYRIGCFSKSGRDCQGQWSCRPRTRWTWRGPEVAWFSKFQGFQEKGTRSGLSSTSSISTARVDSWEWICKIGVTGIKCGAKAVVAIRVLPPWHRQDWNWNWNCDPNWISIRIKPPATKHVSLVLFSQRSNVGNEELQLSIDAVSLT